MLAFFSRLAVGCLALGGVTAASAQNCPCTSYSDSVTITVTEGDNQTARVDNTRACVTRTGTVRWITTDGDSFVIRFDKNDGTPFAPGQLRGTRAAAANARVSRSNNVRCGRLFRYSISLTKGGRNLPLDPEVIVEPSF
jgi:hypothetical protein